METINNSIVLLKLSEIENLSARSRNICEWNNLNDISSILQFFWDNGDFLKLRNCGQKSSSELLELCKKYENFIPKSLKLNESLTIENAYLNKVNSLTVWHKKILNNIIESQAHELSTRSLNALNKYLNFDLSIRGLMPILINNSFDLKKLDHIGEKSKIELKNFLAYIKDQIEISSSFKNENELMLELFNSYLIRKFIISPQIIAEIGENYDFKNGLPVFKTCSVLIKHEILFDERNKILFEKAFNYFNPSKLCSLDEIASIVYISRERTRQIRNEIFENLNTTLSFINGLEFEALNLYGIDTNSDFIIISDELISEINQKENNSFNHLFVNKILSVLLENSFTLVGDEKSIVFELGKLSRSLHDWNSTYLIKKELTNFFNFEAFVNDVNRRLNERIEEDYSFYFESYLLKFQLSEMTDNIEKILPIAEHIIFSEFEISINVDDQLVFKRKTKKQVAEYIYEILEEKNKPLTVYEIFDLMEQKYPNVTKSAESLRGNFSRDSNLIYFGRSSTYGLKIWEDAKTIKGGTMHDISEEYLAQFDEPKHINDVSKYVSNYRNDVTSKNLLYNLKSAENRRFIFFKNNHIGITSKTYNTEYKKNY